MARSMDGQADTVHIHIYAVLSLTLNSSEERKADGSPGDLQEHTAVPDPIRRKQNVYLVKLKSTAYYPLHKISRE